MLPILDSQTIVNRAWADYRMVLCIGPELELDYSLQDGEMPGVLLAPSMKAAARQLDELDRMTKEARESRRAQEEPALIGH